MFCADLHCDLLSYLAENEGRSAFDPESRSSITQLQQGRVCLQTLAVYTKTAPGSAAFAEKQFKVFSQLARNYPYDFQRLEKMCSFSPSTRVQIVAAIENASGLCEESEHLCMAFERLERYFKEAGPILYISLTWNDENRFGGGNHSKTGLKPDGESLLEYLDGKKCAVDLSHTSDALAEEILSYIHKKSLKLIPIASHSNFRAVCNQPRNLTDRVAQEIVKRGGVIGLNLFRPFVGNHFESDCERHLEHAKELGALENFCLGADFFYDNDYISTLYPKPYFQKEFENAGCFPHLLSCLNRVCSDLDVEKVAYRNLNAFLERL